MAEHEWYEGEDSDLSGYAFLVRGHHSEPMGCPSHWWSTFSGPTLLYHRRISCQLDVHLIALVLGPFVFAFHDHRFSRSWPHLFPIKTLHPISSKHLIEVLYDVDLPEKKY